MNNFNYILLFFFFLNLAIPTYAQEGFNVIRKAEAQFQKGNSEKALKLLIKAKTMGYGPCGNAAMDANRSINLLRAKIYMTQEKYQEARNSLDSIYAERRLDNLDSIRIRTLQLEFGKDSMSNMLDSSLPNVKIECGESDCYAILPFTNGKIIRLKINTFRNREITAIWFETNKEEIWINWFKQSEYYAMLKEKG